MMIIIMKWKKKEKFDFFGFYDPLLNSRAKNETSKKDFTHINTHTRTSEMIAKRKRC